MKLTPSLQTSAQVRAKVSTTMKTITFPIDSENRQLKARLTPNGWQMIERDTTRKNAIRFIEVDAEMSAQLDAEE